MSRVNRAALTLALPVVAAFLSALAPSATAGGGIGTDRIAVGLAWPNFVTHAPNDPNRVFVLEKDGRIRIIDITTDTLLGPSFLDIDALVVDPTSAGDERGLLGLAFHPDYAINGYFYVNYYSNAAVSTIARYQVLGDPATSNTANPASALIMLTFTQPFSNHNGGWLGFSPNDGYLYIATGDGGSACDPGQRAQDITSQPLGKMLRLDVDAAAPYTPASNPFFGAILGDDNIWAYGLRNPWRPSFDRATGDLLIADVGQGQWEEINFQPVTSAGGVNYGWDCTEGFACPAPGCAAGACACGAAALTAPKHVYSHASGCSITGGYVYRGCAIPSIEGQYFFADYCSNIIWSAVISAGGVAGLTVRTAHLSPSIDGFAVQTITSFGEDAHGEMYIVDNGGEIFRIVPDPLIDCNGNHDADSCDIADGSSLDVNANDIPDDCECISDLDGSGDTGFGDVTELLLNWGPCPPFPDPCPWDLDGSGDVGFGDYTLLLLGWGPC